MLSIAGIVANATVMQMTPVAGYTLAAQVGFRSGMRLVCASPTVAASADRRYLVS